MEAVIVPSIIAKTQKELDAMLEKLKGKAERVMLDIMDGKFVSNTSLDFDFCVPEGFVYEAHLMTMTPLEWIEKHGHKVNIVILQVETLYGIKAAIDLVHGRGKEVFLALNPETELESLLPHLKHVDGVLVMTVHPGSFCIEFLPETLEKVRTLRKIDPRIPIEVDGCMNPYHVRLASEAGANIFDSGSYIMKSKDVEETLVELRDAVIGCPP